MIFADFPGTVGRRRRTVILFGKKMKPCVDGSHRRPQEIEVINAGAGDE